MEEGISHSRGSEGRERGGEGAARELVGQPGTTPGTAGESVYMSMCVSVGEEKRRGRRREKEKKRKERERDKKRISVCVCVKNLRQDCGERTPGGFFPSFLGRRAAAGLLNKLPGQLWSTENMN